MGKGGLEMITIHWFGLVSICFLIMLFGVVIGTKTSTDRWIEYQEYLTWKNRKAQDQ
jgi:hypothetical protein